MVDKNMQSIPSPVVKLGVEDIAGFERTYMTNRANNFNRFRVYELQLVDAINHGDVDATFVIAFVMNDAIIVRF